MSELTTFFATCAPGLEPILHKEIQDLRMAKVERQVGGVRFSGKTIDMQRANLWLRTAGRVLMRIARYEAHGSDGLYDGAKEVAWENWLKPGATLRVDSQTRDSDLD
ncbi:MAG TPA: THUMP domain-containing protein, partial [Planctomycetota bacterium]|nr:THUMP domain-containing protein [Planctomycetota bacterium]